MIWRDCRRNAERTLLLRSLLAPDQERVPHPWPAGADAKPARLALRKGSRARARGLSRAPSAAPVGTGPRATRARPTTSHRPARATLQHERLGRGAPAEPAPDPPCQERSNSPPPPMKTRKSKSSCHMRSPNRTGRPRGSSRPISKRRARGRAPPGPPPQRAPDHAQGPAPAGPGTAPRRPCANRRPQRPQLQLPGPRTLSARNNDKCSRMHTARGTHGAEPHERLKIEPKTSARLRRRAAQHPQRILHLRKSGGSGRSRSRPKSSRVLFVRVWRPAFAWLVVC